MIPTSLLALAVCLIAQTQFVFVSAFQSIMPVSTSTTLHTKTTRVAKLNLVPELQDTMQQLSTTPLPTVAASIPVSSDDVESWRQYVPLAVTGAVILDILLGNPLANMVLAPMKRASEKGAQGNIIGGDDDEEDGDSMGGSLFSSFNGGGDGNRRRSLNERVDSKAIAQAAYDKAMNTLELKRFLEENQTAEQSYEEVRKKIDRQLEDLED